MKPHIAFITPTQTAPWSPAFPAFKYKGRSISKGIEYEGEAFCLNRSVFLELLNVWNCSGDWKYCQPHNLK